MPLEAETVDKLMRLSALRLCPGERIRLQADLDKIVALIDVLQTADTDGIEPLAHALDGCQPLRPDMVTESVDRDAYQRTAPEVRDGLYLVPRVVE